MRAAHDRQRPGLLPMITTASGQLDRFAELLEGGRIVRLVRRVHSPYAEDRGMLLVGLGERRSLGQPSSRPYYAARPEPRRTRARDARTPRSPGRRPAQRPGSLRAGRSRPLRRGRGSRGREHRRGRRAREPRSPSSLQCSASETALRGTEDRHRLLPRRSPLARPRADWQPPPARSTADPTTSQARPPRPRAERPRPRCRARGAACPRRPRSAAAHPAGRPRSRDFGPAARGCPVPAD